MIASPRSVVTFCNILLLLLLATTTDTGTTTATTSAYCEYHRPESKDSLRIALAQVDELQHFKDNGPQ
jgi:hypothetical protein